MGKTLRKPDLTRGLIWNMLLSMDFVDPVTQKPRPADVSCLSKLFILYADHEMSNATAALLLVASSCSDPLSCLVAAYVACYGLTHGGALDVVYKQLKYLALTKDIPSFLEDVKAKKAILYGFGHRVYKAKDPRAALFRRILQEARGGIQNPILDAALELERLTDRDEWFSSRNWYMNGDLFACVTYTCL